MKKSISASLPNSLVLVMDYASGEPPEVMGETLVASSGSCLAIGTLAEQSGETEFLLTDEIDAVEHSTMHLAFDGHIEVTSGEVSLVSVLNQPLVTLPVSSSSVRVRVLANDMEEPNCIAVLLG
ncbi:hypothetical protein [Piscinibacter sp. HJYY11]|uniref:hypothetical protein n=1 Tax=Piscinibacter sp. HJYY11 TaxID=2801333 RepID=UPI00192001E5|nr:hypothetical protein [Piscinibacter sp. HJYY11]MBL0729591.1 hypothetical protein [Piscinibacter sp. HJYY11]